MSNEGKETEQPRIVWMKVAEPHTGKAKLPWFQFRLIEVFVVLTVSCIMFAAVGAFGVDGFLERIGAVAFFVWPFTILFEYWYRWRRNRQD